MCSDLILQYSIITALDTSVTGSIINQNDDTYIMTAEKTTVIVIFGFQWLSAYVTQVKKSVSLCVLCTVQPIPVSRHSRPNLLVGSNLQKSAAERETRHG